MFLVIVALLYRATRRWVTRRRLPYSPHPSLRHRWFSLLPGSLFVENFLVALC